MWPTESGWIISHRFPRRRSASRLFPLMSLQAAPIKSPRSWTISCTDPKSHRVGESTNKSAPSSSLLRTPRAQRREQQQFPNTIRIGLDVCFVELVHPVACRIVSDRVFHDAES